MADETKPLPPAKKAEATPNEGPPSAAEVKATKAQHDKVIAQAIVEERKANPANAGRPMNFGPFADHPQRFRVLHEAVGPHARDELLTYRDLVVWNGAKGGGPDYESPNATQTKANVDRLIALGAIEPVREYA